MDHANHRTPGRKNNIERPMSRCKLVAVRNGGHMPVALPLQTASTELAI